MSKSFSLVNGDLHIANRSFEVVSAQDKLIQDLSLWIRERIGTDPSTPNYGSTLDGGIINGREVAPFIGRLLDPQVKAEIIGEVYGIVRKYQGEQLEKIKSEAIKYKGRNTLERGEVIDTINNVSVKNIGTTVLVRVSLTTLASKTVTLTLPISAGV